MADKWKFNANQTVSLLIMFTKARNLFKGPLEYSCKKLYFCKRAEENAYVC